MITLTSDTDCALDILEGATKRARTHVTPEHWRDAGPAVLATLLSKSDAGSHHDQIDRAGPIVAGALDSWLALLQGRTAYPGVFGGLAGLYVGVQAISTVQPRLTVLATLIRDALVHWSNTNLRSAHVKPLSWQDYDLISGPSGVLLALATDPNCPPDAIVPCARHLARLADEEDLSGLRVGAYEDDEQRRWNKGRINTGLAHGVTGVAAALRAAFDLTADDDIAGALKRICHWLVAASYVDDRGIRTWQPGGREGVPDGITARPRQAWCYGAPAVAWVLWDSARALEDAPLRAFAEDTMTRYCAGFDDAFHLDPAPIDATLGICHGAAGILAVADAFANHAGMNDAEALALRMERFLRTRFVDVDTLASSDMTVLTGASGILAMLLVRRGGARGWLPHLGLR